MWWLHHSHNPYFTGNSFAIQRRRNDKKSKQEVTILILLETLLQFEAQKYIDYGKFCHNPYFTGNSFAIEVVEHQLLMIVPSQSLFYWKLFCNLRTSNCEIIPTEVTILILLETLLQYNPICFINDLVRVTILILLETLLQLKGL